jgi:hypothetical protein
MRGRLTGDSRPELLETRNAVRPPLDCGRLAYTRQGM